MREPFHSSKYSIAHAKRRIRELEGEIAIFLKSDPYTRLVHTDTQRGKDIHKIKLIKPMPVAVPGTAFDALNNLRSALDQAGYACASAVDPAKGKHAHFPFGDTVGEADSRKNGRSKDIPCEIFDHMISFKPYRGGNDLLWALNKMCNSNKHEVITPLIVGNTGVSFGQGVSEVELPIGVTGSGITSIWGSGRFGRFAPVNCIDDEIEVFTVTSGQGSKYDLTLTFFVGVTKVDVVSGQAIDTLLNDFAGVVEGVVLGIEAEARRIGLVK
jgi:hypothetical protein